MRANLQAMAVVLLLASIARAGEPRISLQPAELEPPAEIRDPKPRWGEPGHDWITLGGGVAHDFADATDLNLHAAWTHFIVPDAELTLELNAWAFSQAGDDAFGVSPAFALRYHVINEERWSIFGEAGLGLLLASDDVPADGTSFDFMPRLGVGFTREIAPDGTRLECGLRWHHISNARLNGDLNNPSRDAPMLFVGIVIPW